MNIPGDENDDKIANNGFALDYEYKYISLTNLTGTFYLLDGWVSSVFSELRKVRFFLPILHFK